MKVTYTIPMKFVGTPPELIVPQIAFSPRNLSFTESDWKLENGKSIKIAIYIPAHTHINELQCKLSIPSGWDITPNAEISRTTYVQAQDTIYANDLGNFGENEEYITDLFWIKPAANTVSDKFHLFANSHMDYIYRDDTGQDHRNIVNISETINLALIKNEDPIDWLNTIGVLCTIIGIILAIYKLHLDSKEKK